MSKKNEPKAELIVPEKNTALQSSFNIDDETIEVIKTNLAGVNIGNRGVIKTPAGGGTSFVISTLEGEQEQKEISGVILGHKPSRSLFLGKMGDGKPPACVSTDGQSGAYDPAQFEGRPEPSGICGRGRCHYANPSAEL